MQRAPSPSAAMSKATALPFGSTAIEPLGTPAASSVTDLFDTPASVGHVSLRRCRQGRHDGDVLDKFLGQAVASLQVGGTIVGNLNLTAVVFPNQNLEG